jgi:hypothetical protein
MVMKRAINEILTYLLSIYMYPSSAVVWDTDYSLFFVIFNLYLL